MKRIFKYFLLLVATAALLVAYIRKFEVAVCFVESIFERIKFAAAEIARSEQGIE